MTRFIAPAAIALAALTSPVLAGSVGPNPATYDTDITAADVPVTQTDDANVEKPGYFPAGLHAVNPTAVRILSVIHNEGGIGSAK